MGRLLYHLLAFSFPPLGHNFFFAPRKFLFRVNCKVWRPPRLPKKGNSSYVGGGGDERAIEKREKQSLEVHLFGADPNSSASAAGSPIASAAGARRARFLLRQQQQQKPLQQHFYGGGGSGRFRFSDLHQLSVASGSN